MNPQSGSSEMVQFTDGWWILPGVAAGVLLWVPILRAGWQFLGG
ncbi:hypothetical protein QEZ52_13705 [Aliisedimentitalea scapharcae]|uniref:Uncharacterized protein n=1 Tax=Aliisedimentitalea scapharcae TaxID=1524259 RepID=A0ABZ2XNL5_9RHOB